MFVNIEFLTSLTVASILWRPAPCLGSGWEAEDDVDILLLAHRHYRRQKKKSRDKSDHDSEPTPTSLHFPPPKRRKIFRSKQVCTTEIVPEAESSVVHDGNDRNGPVHSEIQQNQASSSVQFFPIFKSNFNSDIRQEQGGKQKKSRAKAKTIVKVQQNTITNHFISKAKNMGPDDQR